MVRTSFPLSAGLAGAFKALGRPALGLTREVPVHVARLTRWGRGPTAVFLPAYGPEGAALLRIYAMARALRPLGWRTLCLPPGLDLHQRRRLLSRLAPDVVVMQGARHALNRPALYPGHRVVFDMDDADFHLPHLAGPVRRAMANVAAVVAGSAYVADWCLGAGAPEAHVVWTGAPVSARPWPAPETRPPVIAWAQSRPMSYTREADWVRRVTARIAARRPGATLRLFDFRSGDDPGFADSFRAPGLSVEWRRACGYGDYLAAFADVAVGLAPLCPETPFSRGKSFGKILAYLDARVPVVASDAGEHAAFFTPDTGVVSNDPGTWVDAVCLFLNDGASRAAQAEAAFSAYRARLSTEAAAARLGRILAVVAGREADMLHNMSYKSLSVAPGSGAGHRR